LYYRLRVVEIRLPPLRERKEDIPVLVRHFIEKFAKRDARPIEGIAPEALGMLEGYGWPGNVRELENSIEHAIALAEDDARQITAEMLPAHLRPEAVTRRSPR